MAMFVASTPLSVQAGNCSSGGGSFYGLTAGYARTFSDGYDLNAPAFGQQIGVTFPRANNS